ncbi:MAG: iron-containing alcohol dehydrogenase [Deltaproteobacteria bacterium]|jgi:alcohol dehydrogenase|nr:iron-containing alcohol dehydrogenase [Deltaproteobacteria bacterium]
MLITNFLIFAPVIMGPGSVNVLEAQAKALGIKKAILVYDKGIEAVGIAEKIRKPLLAAGVTLVEYNGVVPDPTDVTVDEAAKLARDNDVDAVIGVGGGSTMDTCKGVNLLLTNPGKIADYFIIPPVIPGSKPGKKMILIPTTAGTGSECTIAAVFTDTVNKRKCATRSPANQATIAIIDPDLSSGMPPRLTASTGMDALAHAVESITIIPPRWNIISELFSIKAIQDLVKYLPIAVNDGKNIEAREKCAVASMLAGSAFANTLVHLGHAFGHSIGAKLHMPHGECCGVTLAHAMDYVADAVPDKVKLVGETMGLTFEPGATAAVIGRKTAERILAFQKEIKLPTLKDFGASREDVVAASELVPGDSVFRHSPKPIEMDKIKEILGKIYDGVF